MIKKFQHFNENVANVSVLSELSTALSKINIDTLRTMKGIGKSNFVATEIENHFANCKIDVAVTYEQQLSPNYKDKIDVVVNLSDVYIIIEIDNMRADQLSKKVLSRTVSCNKENFVLVSLLYDSASAKGHKEECLKYINFHLQNFFLLHKNVEYLAFLPNEYHPGNKDNYYSWKRS